MRARWLAGLLGLGLATLAQAGLFDDDEARRQIAELRRQVQEQNLNNEARFNRLDDAIKNLGVIQLLQQIEMLNAELARLRGQLEVLNHQNEQLQKRQRDFYVDLDTRMRRLEGGDTQPQGAAAPTALPATAAQTTPAAARPPANPALEAKAYDVAQNHFKRGDYARAIEAYSTFLQSYAGSALAANAQYWLGISHFNLRDFKNALDAQESLVKLYPESQKVPDSLLAIGTIQLEQGDLGSARNTFEDVIAKYPGSDAASKARARLATVRR